MSLNHVWCWRLEWSSLVSYNISIHNINIFQYSCAHESEEFGTASSIPGWLLVRIPVDVDWKGALFYFRSLILFQFFVNLVCIKSQFPWLHVVYILLWQRTYTALPRSSFENRKTVVLNQEVWCMVLFSLCVCVCGHILSPSSILLLACGSCCP